MQLYILLFFSQVELMSKNIRHYASRQVDQCYFGEPQVWEIPFLEHENSQLEIFQGCGSSAQDFIPKIEKNKVHLEFFTKEEIEHGYQGVNQKDRKRKIKKETQQFDQSSDLYQFKNPHISVGKTKGQKLSSLREVKKWYGKAEIMHSISEFITYLEGEGKSVSQQVLQKHYPNHSTKKSKKYLIHCWYNLVSQGFSSDYFWFLTNVSLNRIWANLETNYSDKPKSFHDKIKGEIIKIYRCFQNFEKEQEIKSTVYELYEAVKQKGKKIHETKQKNAEECFIQLGELFPSY